MACGSDGGSPATGGGGDATGGGEAAAGAPMVTAGTSSGSGGSAVGGASGSAGSSSDAGASDTAGATSGGSGSEPSVDYGQLLFDAPGAGALAKGELFRTATGLVWVYELEGKSFVATGPASGGERVDLVESSAAITAFNVASVIAYQAGSKLFAHPVATTKQTPVELEGAPSCTALSSAAGFVYCRSSTGTIVRWADSGGAATVLATGVPPGADLVADAAPVNPSNRKLYFCEDQGAISSIPLGGFGGGPILAPQYFQINKTEKSPRGLRVGVPGDDVLYWISAPSDAPARIRGSAKTTPPVSNAGPPLEATQIFTPYSWSAGAIIAIEHPDTSAQVAFVRFGQTFITPHFESLHGVVALTAEAGRYYWLDRDARVFTGTHQ